MRSPSHLYRRNGIFYFRWAIPLSCRDKLGFCPADVRVSLGTHQRVVANRRSAEMWLRALTLADRILAGGPPFSYNDVLRELKWTLQMVDVVDGGSEKTAPVVPTLVTKLAADVSLKEMQLTISELYAAQVLMVIPVTCAADVYKWVAESDQDASWQQCDRVANFSGNAVLGSDHMSAILASQNYSFSIQEFYWYANEASGAGSGTRHRIVADEPIQCLMLDILAHWGGAAVPKKSLHAVAQVATSPVPAQAPLFQTTMSEGLEEWLKVRSDWSETTRVAARGAVRNLISIVGDKNPANVTPTDFANFASLHTTLPGDYFSRPKKYEGKTVEQVARDMKGTDAKGFSERTKANKLEWINRFFSYLESKGYVPMNVAGGLAPKVNASIAKEARDPFSDADIQKIFGVAGLDVIANYVAREGKQIAFWGPLVALFTGARAQEIALLSVENVLQLKDAGWAICITDENTNESGAQRLKTGASKRTLPLHDSLEQLGFLKFVDVRRRAGSNALLFPEVEMYAVIHQRHRAMTKWFNNSFLKKIDVKTDRKSFHSFRHAVSQKFFGDASLAYKAHQFTGHEAHIPDGVKQSVQRNTYGRYFEPEELRDLLPLLDYGLDVPEIKRVAEELLKNAT